MNQCSCYFKESREVPRYDIYTGEISYFVEEIYGRCNGTKERDECSCGGDMTKCDFYPKVRKEALKRIELEPGKWISIMDRLPERGTRCLVCIKNNITGYRWIDIIYYSEDKNITHWMPLPEPPKGE